MTTSYTTTVTENGVTFERVEGPFFSNMFAVEPGSSDCQTGILGKYDARFQRIFICYNGSATPEAELAASIRHEIFHAFQHGFRNFDAAWSQTSGLNATAVEDMQWIREGTAAAAEESAGTMHRNKVQVPPLHAVNRALTASDYQPPPAEVADVIAYSAQDFWVYLGKKAGSTELGLNYLTELFSRGLSPDAVDSDALGSARDLAGRCSTGAGRRTRRSRRRSISISRCPIHATSSSRATRRSPARRSYCSFLPPTGRGR